jgi:hypothetical protein
MTPKRHSGADDGGPAHPRTLPGRTPQHSNVCPRFFRDLVQEARMGERSFADCGYELGRRLLSIVGEELGEEVIGELVLAISKGDHAAALEWLKKRVPKMMELVPPRQYRSFMKGFLRAVQKGMIEVHLPRAA